jgi:hypothetical protein
MVKKKRLKQKSPFPYPADIAIYTFERIIEIQPFSFRITYKNSTN